jgi:predicted GIY-YIG superfamily endonuclease
MSHVYLLHFTKPLSHARHYCGWTPRLVADRLKLHETGRGANICKHAVLNGAELELIRVWNFNTWQEAREFECKLKRTHNLGRYCPLCRDKLGKNRR